MKEIIKLKVFWVVSILASAVVFVALLNLNFIYKSETEVLVIPKSASAIENTDQILENLRIIPTTLAFYNKLIKNNPNIIDEGLSQITDDKKKAAWNKIIEVERLEKSGIIKIKAYHKIQPTAEFYSAHITKELINGIGVFYNIKDDINLRIIEGPITSSGSQKSELVLASVSLLIGFLVVLASFSMPNFALGKKTDQKLPNPIKYTWNKKKPQANEGQEFFASTQKDTITATKKAMAPDNLPIASISEESANEIIVPDTTPVIKEATSEEVKNRLNKLLRKEASPEEVKERLNKLLNGQL